MGLLAGAALFAALLSGAGGSSDAVRFALDDAALERADGGGASRYSLEGDWTLAEASGTRFELKATLESDGATCGVQADGLFANGFE